MTTDNYQPCPCGSGKKIKFCKCVDQPQEYEKLLKLTQGGQELAAMERINQLLAKTPNAAWLLAMKAEISLRLSEFDTFKETVSRFYKLKPDNPLALIMRSLVSLSEGEPLTEGVRLLLEGLAESRESVHEIALDALQVLCTRLSHSPQACLRQYYLELIEKLTGGEVRVEQVDPGLPDDSILCNGFAEVDTNWHGKPWAERAQEVESLISTFRHAQAESKLRSILRDYPDQAWPLQKLLQVQMLLLDQEGATATARKLSCQRDLPEKTRDFYAALVLELEPGKPGLTCPMLSRYVELESDDQARQALSSLKSLHPLNRQEHRESMEMMAMSVGDEVPAVDMYAALATRTVANGTPYVVNVGAVSLLASKPINQPAPCSYSFRRPPEKNCFNKCSIAWLLSQS